VGLWRAARLAVRRKQDGLGTIDLSEYQRARRVEESVYMARVDGLHFRTYPSPRIVRRRLV
jgi:hypothetical protein